MKSQLGKRIFRSFFLFLLLVSYTCSHWVLNPQRRISNLRLIKHSGNGLKEQKTKSSIQPPSGLLGSPNYMINIERPSLAAKTWNQSNYKLTVMVKPKWIIAPRFYCNGASSKENLVCRLFSFADYESSPWLKIMIRLDAWCSHSMLQSEWMLQLCVDRSAYCL